MLMRVEQTKEPGFPNDLHSHGECRRRPKVNTPTVWSGDRDGVGFQEHAFKLKNCIVSHHSIAQRNLQEH